MNEISTSRRSDFAQNIVRQARRAWIIFRCQGPRRFTTSGVSWMQAKLGRPSANQIKYIQQKARVDAAFDAKFGVSTGGVEYLHDLTILGRNSRFGVNHVASDPIEFEDAMARIDLDLSTTTFMDLGSGRGRALMMAAMLPFRRIIGLEFAKELHEASIHNIRRAFPHLTGSDRITLILGDATDFEVPDGPLVLYLYNPFDAPIIAAVARNVLLSWQNNPRSIRVVYLNPVFGSEWHKAGWECLEENFGCAIFAPSLY